MTDQFNIVVEQDRSTVVARYEAKPVSPDAYQSEAQLEQRLIDQLVGLGYEYAREVTDEPSLIRNLRCQLEALNDYHFSDLEWNRFFSSDIAGENLRIEDKTQIIQRDYVRLLICDNGENRNIRLIDKRNIHNNRLQVINQYVPADGTALNRYDVTILVNGLPLVHVELKRRGVSIREAFNQISRYQRESFWAGRALFDYVQIFIISNGTQTKYYSNTTRFAKEEEQHKQNVLHQKVESNSFEFISWWTDAENRQVCGLQDFANTFLSAHTLLNVLTRYCVFTVDKQLMVMRPYQIAATERILLHIQTAINHRWQGQRKAGGYIWHTTGSGKTLTSFKTAQLATQLPEVKKVLFVVDRQDLDYQTMKEYNNFEKDSANSNANYRVLLRQLNDPNCHIIITTIQKLSSLLKSKREDISILDDNVVMIFDECHRSQFGEMHAQIVKRFQRYMIFGFTGTPIFSVNAQKAGKSHLKTTEQVFGTQLHSYTIINAINDHNVLPFHVDYVSTMKAKAEIADTSVWGIEEDSALHAPERIRKVVTYILDHYAQKTKQQEQYGFAQTYNIAQIVTGKHKVQAKKNKVALSGFNSILAVDSIDSAIAYYNEFYRQMENRPEKALRIATIFTYAANEEENDMGYVQDENPDEMGRLSATAKEFLAGAINKYNATFGTNYDISGDKFGNYYKDVSLRMKNRDIDLLIVVGMFLTGFDAKTLNTLWVDKNLKMHGLLQAYSRTNRILNSVKDCGNIVCFRNLEKATNDSFALFGDKNAGGVIVLRPFRDYYEGYDDEKGHHEGYIEVIRLLQERFPLSSLQDMKSEKEQKDFVRLMSRILRMQNLLAPFDQYTPEDDALRQKMQIISDGERQDYLSWYNHLHEDMVQQGKHNKEIITDDVEFEMELVKQIQINIDYILMLVQRYHDSLCQDKEIALKIRRSIDASPDMRDKKDLILRFIERMTPSKGDVFADWTKYIAEQKEQQLSAIIADEHLNDTATRSFVSQAFRDGYVTETGTAITKILPPMPLFGAAAGQRAETKARVLEKIKLFFARFLNIG